MAEGWVTRRGGVSWFYFGGEFVYGCRLHFMKLNDKPLWIAAGVTLLLQLYLCFFFSFGATIPVTGDLTPGLLPVWTYRFPPTGYVQNSWWLGIERTPSMLTPLSVLAHLPMWWFFTMMYPLAGALAVVTFYLFLRELGLSPLACVVGGVMFGWHGHLFSNVFGGHFAPSWMLVFFPLAMWAAVRACRGGNWRHAMAAGVCTAIMLGMGNDQGALAALLVGAVFLAAVARALWLRAAGWWRILARLGLTMLTAAVVAAPQFQLASQFGGGEMKTPGSEDPRVKYAWATQWSWPPEETLQFLAPGFFGWRTGDPEGPYWGRMGGSEGWAQTRQGFRNFSLESSVIGTLPFVLLCVGAWWCCRRREETSMFVSEQRFYALLFAAIGVVTYALSMGKYTPVYGWFYQLPYMSTWRNPNKFLLVLSNFCFVVVAAYGAHAFIEVFGGSATWERFRGVMRRWLMAGVGVIGVVLVLVVLFAGGIRRGLLRDGYTPSEVDAIGGVMWASVLVAGAVLGAAWLGVVLLQKLRAERRALILAIGMAALCVVQMFWIDSHYVEPFNAKIVYQTNPLIEELRKSGGAERVTIFPPQVQHQDLILHSYLSNVFPSYNIACLDIPAASRIPTDVEMFFHALGQNPVRLWQVSGVRYLATVSGVASELGKHPSFSNNIAQIRWYRAMGTRLDDAVVLNAMSQQESTHALVELKDFLPKAQFVANIETLDNESAVAQRLGAADWNPRGSMLVSRTTGVTPLPMATRRGAARLLRYTETMVEIEAETDNGGYLLVNDHYDAGWHAQINGKNAKVFRANLLMRGIELPTGKSRVTLRYSLPVWPGYVSLVGYVVVGGVLLFSWKRGADNAVE